ncbi:hypothetical protein QZH41_004570 [Actinostola sp. cb2023]|nr:hypothetical protein QZH41_004570 [Actinostola sp. cb2023]
MAENPRNRVKSVTEEKLLKERLLDEKMKLIRQKNEERLKRQKEIEEDIRNAKSNSEEIANKGLPQPVNKMSGVKTEVKPVSKVRGRARGRILEKMAKEQPQAHRFQERQKLNYMYELVEKELHEEKASPGLGKSTGFLSDDRRADMSRVTSRSSHSWGENQFEDVVDKISKEHPRRKREQNMDIVVTGQERLGYQEWKEERSKIDQERQSRQKRGDTWHREWDKCKDQKESGSSGGREDRTHSGQRFGDRTRRKPDWNHHDNRDDDLITDSMPTSTHSRESEKVNETRNVVMESSEDWDDNQVDEPTKGGTTCTNDMGKRDVAHVNKGEDWEESVTGETNIHAENTKFDISANAVVSEADKDIKTENLCYKKQTDNGDTEEISKSSESDELDIAKRVENITVTVDPQGNRNVTDTCSEVVESSTDNLEESMSNTNRQGEASSNSSKGENEQGECRLDSSRTEVANKHNSNASSDCSSDNKADKTEEEESRTEMNLQKLDPSVTKDNKPTEEAGIGMTEVPTNEVKAKDNLPKLDLTKIEAEPVPDFLKTPQKKDWADYDFDEDEFDFSQDLVYYQ